MKTKMRQTSLDAYWGLEKLPAKRKVVLKALEAMGAACNLDVSERLGWSINRVTPRMNELVKDGYVVESHRGICRQTDRRVIYWKLR